MRTGAIFARGSCRALKWMALFGVVFALGVGLAAAQSSLAVDAVSIRAATAAGNVDEDTETTLTVHLDRQGCATP